MKSLRHVLVITLALAAVSAGPSGGAGEQKDSLAPDAGDRLQDALGQDALRRMFTELAAENVKLRKEVKDLRADNDALKDKLQASERQLRQWRANRGALAVPPQAPQGQPSNAVPPGWRPFEFNCATYYVVPLKAGLDDGGTRANTLMEVEPAQTPARRGGAK
jgi:hypothetical protein